jgi:hypothetical protein
VAHPIEELIATADAAIVREDFDALLDVYAEDAVLVDRPGVNVTGKVSIRSVFERIAAYFEHALAPGPPPAPRGRAGVDALHNVGEGAGSALVEEDDLALDPDGIEPDLRVLHPGRVEPLPDDRVPHRSPG